MAHDFTFFEGTKKNHYYVWANKIDRSDMGDIWEAHFNVIGYVHAFQIIHNLKEAMSVLFNAGDTLYACVAKAHHPESYDLLRLRILLSALGLKYTKEANNIILYRMFF